MHVATPRRFHLTIWQRNTLTSYLFLLPFYILFVVFVLVHLSDLN